MKRPFTELVRVSRKSLASASAAVPLWCGAAAEANLVFPADSGVIDVAAAGAIPNVGVDDTAIIQSLLDANPSGNTIFYFRDGVYDLSDTLRPAEDDGVTKRNIFQGQSEGGVVLKLQDNLGADFTGAVIDYNANATITNPPAQFFRNAVRNLTIDAGDGNPNAIGLRFNASNQGTIRNVTIKAGADNTATGLVTGGNEPGPLLWQDVTVDGFGTGVRTVLPTASQTLENITLRNQKTLGWENDVTQQVFARGIDFEGDVQAVRNENQSSMLLIDSTLTGVGPAANAAVFNNKRFYARDVDTTGFDEAIDNTGVLNAGGRGNRRSGDAPYVHEHWANGAYGSDTDRRGGALELFDSPDTSLRLEVRDHPTLAYAPVSDWASPLDFGGVPNDGIDDTAAIQAAIDSGKSTVYLANGTWTIDGTLSVRGDVERILGAEAKTAGSGTIRIEGGSAETVFIERLESLRPVEHASSRSVAFEHVLGMDYQIATLTPGDVYLNDVAMDPTVFAFDQNVWARQLNIEGETDATDPSLRNAKIVNNGANVWVLGLKTEDAGTHVRTVNGGKTELLGAIKVGSGATTGVENAQFVTEDASLFVALPNNAPGAEGYEYFAKEVRDGEVRTVRSGQLQSNVTDVYTAFAAPAIAHREVIVDNQDATLSGNWTSSDAFPGGFVDEDFLSAEPVSGNTATFAPDLPEAGDYEVFVRWVADLADAHAGDAVFTINTGGEAVDVPVDMTNGGGFWQSLGVFRFTGTPGDAVVLNAEGADGIVIADAVRFVLADTAIGFLPGDANNDGVVSAADFTAVQSDFGNIGLADGTLLGDANGDGVVSAADFTAIQSNFGNVNDTMSPPAAPDVSAASYGASAGLVAVAVPEPASFALFFAVYGVCSRVARPAR